MRAFLTSIVLISLLPMGVASVAESPTATRQSELPAPNKMRRIIYNNDGSSIFFNFKGGKARTSVTAADVHRWVDEVAGMQVDTYMICPNMCMRLAYPSKVVRMLGAGEEITKENGYDGNVKVCAENIRSLVDQGYDPIGLVIDRAREKGLETFVTYRMNEAHTTHIPESAFNSKFWREHPEWRVGNGPYEQGALNYATPQVRQHMLARLREICDRYGDRIDGLELDWLRFPVHFKIIGSDHWVYHKLDVKNTPVMTQFLRNVRALTNQCGQKRGRPLLLAVRVPPTLALSRQMCLDPVTWADEGLIDFLTVSHFLVDGPREPFELEIARYRKGIPKLPIYGAIQVSDGRQRHTADDYRSIARKLWADGVDGIYLFNFFTPREKGEEPMFSLMSELGDPQSL